MNDVTFTRCVIAADIIVIGAALFTGDYSALIMVSISLALAAWELRHGV